MTTTTLANFCCTRLGTATTFLYASRSLEVGNVSMKITTPKSKVRQDSCSAVSYEEDDTCMSCEEEDTCMSNDVCGHTSWQLTG